MARKKNEKLDSNNEIISPQRKILKEISITYKAKTKRQADLSKEIQNNIITFISGPAGTGKTFISCGESLRIMTVSPDIKNIILVKSVTVTEGEDIGYLKGGLDEKMDPFMESFMDNFYKIIGEEYSKKMRELEMIKILPIAYIRGRSIDNAIIIVDEAQNISMKNMRTILTRIGNNSKMIILGDTKQIDLKNKNLSSLEKTIELFKSREIKNIGYVEFKKEDIVRNPIIIEIEDAFDSII